MKLTNLSARQIRYYEEQQLVMPKRSEGNRRMYSLNDIDRLLEIKDFLDEGINMAGIKHIYDEKERKLAEKQAKLEKPLTDTDVRRILRDEFISVSGLSKQDESSFKHNNNF
ncbi:glutamine synthetase repressor [Liquorilactobacillus hordei DSM 19519]|uniref:Glutamine synthetase repressor n=2 Tax=Liquorilactobacillus hordei TaxID=468911 RepID=A0A0R1MTR0_9LACO|nr:glutamine synthetase repressor [Liquorilactobacillus hordei DSM 19519]